MTCLRQFSKIFFSFAENTTTYHLLFQMTCIEWLAVETTSRNNKGNFINYHTLCY